MCQLLNVRRRRRTYSHDGYLFFVPTALQLTKLKHSVSQNIVRHESVKKSPCTELTLLTSTHHRSLVGASSSYATSWKQFTVTSRHFKWTHRIAIYTYSNYILNLTEYSRNFVAFSRPLLNAAVLMMTMILQLQSVHIRPPIDCLAYRHNATKFRKLNGETEAPKFVPMNKKQRFRIYVLYRKCDSCCVFILCAHEARWW